MKQFNPTKYMREVYRTYMLRIDRRKYSDVISHLDKMENKSDYVRSLIIKDMANYGKEEKHL